MGQFSIGVVYIDFLKTDRFQYGFVTDDDDNGSLEGVTAGRLIDGSGVDEHNPFVIFIPMIASEFQGLDIRDSGGQIRMGLDLQGKLAQEIGLCSFNLLIRDPLSGNDVDLSLNLLHRRLDDLRPDLGLHIEHAAGLVELHVAVGPVRIAF